jgi:peptide/nickel transport system permease protein
MKNTLRQISHSPKFLIGFFILVFMLLIVILYPVFAPGSPLEMIGQATEEGNFFPPGWYFSLYDASDSSNRYTLMLSSAEEARIAKKLPPADRDMMKKWLVAFGIPESAIDTEETRDLIQLWQNNYSSDIRPQTLLKSERDYARRINDQIERVLNDENLVIADDIDGALTEVSRVSTEDYINISQVANTRFLPLGTDTFGRDVMKELVSALGTSLLVGLLAGAIATFIGLFFGLLAGYVGGWIDNVIMFFANLFTVIPSFVILILISFSIGGSNRNVTLCAIIIGLTSWVWTTRSVRAQVISLRSRDHVNLSKLSGHSLPRIIFTDILPYIASYVVMAFILQIVSGILAEANLSMLGLGPDTTKMPTLGIMMRWSMIYSAHINGAWWAYFPVIITIALVSFSLNLMNTGLDQVFNPQLREG